MQSAANGHWWDLVIVLETRRRAFGGVDVAWKVQSSIDERLQRLGAVEVVEVEAGWIDPVSWLASSQLFPSLLRARALLC